MASGRMNISEVLAWRANLKRDLLKKIEEFEDASGCIVDCIDVKHAGSPFMKSVDLDIVIKI